jgi:uncharacterized protein
MSFSELPISPIFKPIEFFDKDIFEDYSSKYEPYADYVFNNYYSWDTEGAHALSVLNNNLVLKFTDYVTGKPFLSFIGTNEVENTISQLLKLADEKNYEPRLKLIPEINIEALECSDKFIINEDQTSNDYIFSISKIARLSGRHYKNKRQAANKCSRLHNIIMVDGSRNSDAYNQAKDFLIKWNEEKLLKNSKIDLDYEQFAINRMFEISITQENVLLTLAYSNNKVVGFSVDELLLGDSVLSHYFKTLPNYYGLTELLNQHVAQKLESLGYENWNWQQDLGIENLRKMKLGYRPKKLLKKYIIERAPQTALL